MQAVQLDIRLSSHITVIIVVDSTHCLLVPCCFVTNSVAPTILRYVLRVTVPAKPVVYLIY